jgi:hypothetical protein
MTSARIHACADAVFSLRFSMSALAFAGGATMRAHLISVLSFPLAGCVAVTTAGTDETVLFSDREARAETAQAVLKPYNDLPLSIEFACPSRLATLSTSYVVPLPPVLPAGFTNKDVSYLRISMPEGAENAMAQARVITAAGTAIPLSDARQSKRAAGPGTTEVTYALNRKCEALNGSVLEVAGFSYKNKTYPPSAARLHVESRIWHGIKWWPPVL